jgi:hypothetical protein
MVSDGWHLSMTNWIPSAIALRGKKMLMGAVRISFALACGGLLVLAGGFVTRRAGVSSL